MWIVTTRVPQRTVGREVRHLTLNQRATAQRRFDPCTVHQRARGGMADAPARAAGGKPCGFDSIRAHQLSSTAAIALEHRIAPRSRRAVMHRVRQLDCLSSETGSSPVQRAIPESSAAWSIFRKSGNRFSVRKCDHPKRLEALFVRNEEVAGSNPATPTNTASALECGSVF